MLSEESTKLLQPTARRVKNQGFWPCVQSASRFGTRIDRPMRLKAIKGISRFP
jgi:hypothetical protein